MKNKILQTIRKHHLLVKNMHVIIGLSGGPDSLCMFDVLCSMAEEWNLKLYPVHVNHQFRPGAAEADQAFVEKLCQERGWICRTFVRDCTALAREEGLSPEEAGRKVRYDAFAAVGEELVSEKAVPRHRIAIAVGQNADDQAETVLFRLLRGTGIDGLAGIAYRRWDEKGTAVIRPLLDCWRSEIENYCQKQNLEPRRDHTNDETVYMRNRIRLDLLPHLREGFNPNISAGLNRLAASAAADSDFIWREAGKAYEQALVEEDGHGGVSFSLKVLDGLHPTIRIRLYNKALEQMGLKDHISGTHLDGIEAVIHSLSPSASWDLPAGCRAEKQYDRLCFRQKTEEKSSGRLNVRVSSIDDAMDSNGNDAFGGAGDDPNRDAGNDAPVSVYFDAESLRTVYGEQAEIQICMRTRQDGDYMRIRTGDGQLHRKKLQDLFVDMKIPKGLRDGIKLAALGNEILWILPAADHPRLAKKGRVTSAYKAEDNGTSLRIVLEYLF